MVQVLRANSLGLGCAITAVWPLLDEVGDVCVTLRALSFLVFEQQDKKKKDKKKKDKKR